MNGLTLSSMSPEEMQLNRLQGQSQTDWARLRQEQTADQEPAADEDAPDASSALRAYLASKADSARKHQPALQR